MFAFQKKPTKEIANKLAVLFQRNLKRGEIPSGMNS